MHVTAVLLQSKTDTATLTGDDEAMFRLSRVSQIIVAQWTCEGSPALALRESRQMGADHEPTHWVLRLQYGYRRQGSLQSFQCPSVAAHLSAIGESSARIPDIRRAQTAHEAS